MTTEPLAWAVLLADGRLYGRYDFRWEAQAIADALLATDGVPSNVEPLYLSPTLTDALVESLRREVREQRLEIAGLREERRALLAADRPQPDRPEAIATGESDRPEPIGTPEPLSTPGEGTVPPEWLAKPYWVDPPEGWRYGFPRLYDPASDGDMTEWMMAHGYPPKLAALNLPCTFTEWTEDVEK